MRSTTACARAVFPSDSFTNASTPAVLLGARYSSWDVSLVSFSGESSRGLFRSPPKKPGLAIDLRTPTHVELVSIEHASHNLEQTCSWSVQIGNGRGHSHRYEECDGNARRVDRKECEDADHPEHRRHEECGGEKPTIVSTLGIPSWLVIEVRRQYSKNGDGDGESVLSNRRTQ
jgi:hypothetical protein